VSRLPRFRHGLSARHRLALVAAATVLGLVGLTGVAANLRSGAGATPTAVAVPADTLAMINAATPACPALTPARMAGQIMANSGFDPVGQRGDGRGVAGLTDDEWTRWMPSPNAQRDNPRDNILALAHLMCDLVGGLRAAKVPGDHWRLALAAFDVGTDEVVTAGGVPDPAAAYVSIVDAYTGWYRQQPQFRGGGLGTPSPRLTGPATMTSTVPAITTTRSTVTGPPAPTKTPWTPAPGTRSAYSRIEAESYTDQSGTATEATTDIGGGLNVGFLAAGDWLAYARIDFGPVPATRFSVRYASELPTGVSGVVQVRLDSPDGSPVGGAAVASTGGWQSWITVSAGISAVSGVHDVYLTFVSSNEWEIGNINWFEFGH
jgi:Carbohydrate binding module (family 6)